MLIRLPWRGSTGYSAVTSGLLSARVSRPLINLLRSFLSPLSSWQAFACALPIRFLTPVNRLVFRRTAPFERVRRSAGLNTAPPSSFSRRQARGCAKKSERVEPSAWAKDFCLSKTPPFRDQSRFLDSALLRLKLQHENQKHDLVSGRRSCDVHMYGSNRISNTARSR